MNKEQEEKYHNLIYGMLTYPNQAALMLDANQHLLDDGLMQVMEKVATSMAANSSLEAASFLQHLVFQLKDELTVAVGKKASLLENQARKIDLKGSRVECISSQSDGSQAFLLRGNKQQSKEKFTTCGDVSTDSIRQESLDEVLRVSPSLLPHVSSKNCFEEVENEHEWSKWSGLALLLGNILFVIMVVI